MKFSIVIPTYNRAELVFRTLESALAQDYANFEVLVVDDGSTDDTERRFLAYHHPKVAYYRRPNGERGAARNFGASKATGDYLNFFDSDDLMLPNHLSEARKCIEAFDRPEVFAIGFRMEDGAGKVKQTLRHLPDPLNETLLTGNVLGCNPVFVRKDIFERNSFDETRALAGSEDWLLWLRLSARFRFRFWDQVTSRLIDHSGRSVYHFAETKLVGRSEIMLARLSEDEVFMNRYGAKIPGIRAFRYIYTGLHLALSGQVNRPMVFLYKAAVTRPSSLFRKATLGTLKHVLRNLLRLGAGSA